MGAWRYYVRRAGTGLWLDTNAQLSGVELTWALSAPDAGKATVIGGLNATPFAEDGRLTWGKWDTMLFAEEDGELKWVGICNAHYPTGSDLSLEFIGVIGWLQHIPFISEYSSWQVNAFDVVRMLVNHAINISGSRGVPILVTQNLSSQTLGDPAPPPRPVEPGRPKGMAQDTWEGSATYTTWQAAAQAWDDTYGNYAPYSLGWWEGQYVGEEIDTIAKALDFEYRCDVKWADAGNLQPAYTMVLADDMVRRRDDIAFVDGMNIAELLAPKDGDEDYANHIIGLGAGEGRDMVRVDVGDDDGRLYQASFLNYKEVRDQNRLRGLISADLRRLGNSEYAIDHVVVWDIPGYASISTLQVGDEVKVESGNTTPAIDSWRRVVEITRKPEESTATLTLEYAL